MKKLKNKPKPLNLLDLGCGKGNEFYNFGIKQRAHNISFVDPFVDVEQYILDYYNDSTFYKQDAIKFLESCRDNCFNFILIQDILEHISYKYCLIIMSLCRDKLKPNGIVFARVSNGNSLFGLRNQNNNYTHNIFWGFRGLQELFSSSKLNHRHIYPAYEILPGKIGFLHTVVSRIIIQPLCSWIFSPYIGWSKEFFWTPNICIWSYKNYES